MQRGGYEGVQYGVRFIVLRCAPFSRPRSMSIVDIKAKV